jgi:hypothetical protein
MLDKKNPCLAALFLLNLGFSLIMDLIQETRLRSIYCFSFFIGTSENPTVIEDYNTDNLHSDVLNIYLNYQIAWND